MDKRTELLKTFMDLDMSLTTILKYTDPMDGKTEEEKEEMAADLLRKLLSGEITEVNKADDSFYDQKINFSEDHAK